MLLVIQTSMSQVKIMTSQVKTMTRSWNPAGGRKQHHRQRQRLDESSRPAERSRFGSAAGPGWANPACARPAGSTLGGVSGERGQTWYPIGKVGCLSRHIRENLGVTAGQPCLLQPALAQPGWLDDATVARMIGVRQNQAGDLMPFRDQAGRWHAVPGLSPPRRAAVWECEAASDELGRRRAGVLAAAGQLKPVTMEALIARSGSWLRGAA